MNVVSYLKDLVQPTTQIFIKLNEHVFWEGDTIEGSVVVVSTAFPYNAKIKAKLKGVAKGEIVESATLIHEAHLKELVVLYCGEITQRVQSFPFQFKLPQSCAGSFLYDCHGNYGKVYYYVKAIMKVPNRPNKSTRHPFDVLEKADELCAVPIRANSSKNDKVKMSVWSDKNIYAPGDDIVLRIKMNNTEDSNTGILCISLVHAAECGKTFIVDNPNLVQQRRLSFEPPYYYGAKWTAFPIPLKTPASSTRGAITSRLFLQVNYARSKKLVLPITILAKQEIKSLHPPPPAWALPPSALIRPPLLPLDQFSKCYLCGIDFSILKMKSHCYHCGHIFCSECVPSKHPIPKLHLNKPVTLCRPCKRVVEETGGIKYQNPKQVMEEWGRQPSISWVPKYSKEDYTWVHMRVNDPNTECFQAVP